MIEVIKDTAGLEALRDEWDDLLRQSASNCFFLTWEWLYSWWRHVAQRRELCILAVRSGGELDAIAPLAWSPRKLTRLYPFRRLEFLGEGLVGSDYLDFIARRGRETEAAGALGEYLTRKNLVLELGQIRSESCFVRAVAERLRSAGWRVSQSTKDVCPYIDLSGHTWGSYLDSLGSAHRYNFRRRLKHLHASHEVRFERADSEGKRAQALRHLVFMHNERRRQLGDRGGFHTPGLLAFHEALSREALRRRWLRLFVLWLDNEPVASIYGFRYAHTFLFYQSGFDPAHAKKSVGLVAMGLAIQSAIEEGSQEYDLLHGDESYKFHWAAGVRSLGRLELYPGSLRGALCHGISRGGRWLRSAARKAIGDSRTDRILAGGILESWRS